MPNDRQFTHPNFGHETRVEQCGREVRLIFVANTERQAHDLADTIVAQLSQMMGKPTNVTEQ